jgi:prepilin-type processing-associated H-X9-DG protein
MKRGFLPDRRSLRIRGAFTRTDLLVIIAVLSALAAVVTVALTRSRSASRLKMCSKNLMEVGRAVLLFAKDHQETLPGLMRTAAGESWWWYKDEVKGYAGLNGASSPDDRVFACPMDRGYTDPMPFCKNPRFNYSSYVFNGVTLLGTPNIAGWKLSAVHQPARTLLVMEWAAHAPLSWHRSKTGKANAPFYSDAESVVAFADGHVSLTKIYYDGYNAAYTRDPIPGYQYKYSGK